MSKFIVFGLLLLTASAFSAYVPVLSTKLTDATNAKITVTNGGTAGTGSGLVTATVLGWTAGDNVYLQVNSTGAANVLVQMRPTLAATDKYVGGEGVLVTFAATATAPTFKECANTAKTGGDTDPNIATLACTSTTAMWSYTTSAAESATAAIPSDAAPASIELKRAKATVTAIDTSAVVPTYVWMTTDTLGADTAADAAGTIGSAASTTFKFSTLSSSGSSSGSNAGIFATTILATLVAMLFAF